MYDVYIKEGPDCFRIISCANRADVEAHLPGIIVFWRSMPGSEPVRSESGRAYEIHFDDLGHAAEACAGFGIQDESIRVLVYRVAP